MVAVLGFFFIISCDAGKLSRLDANTDDNNTTDKDVVVTDESQDETTDETTDETADETADEVVDEAADEVPDADSCDNECTLGAKQCDPSSFDDSQICMKDSYGCSRAGY